MAPKPLFAPGTKPEDVRKLAAAIFADDKIAKLNAQSPSTSMAMVSSTPAKRFDPNSGQIAVKYGSTVSPKALELLSVFDTPTGIINFGEEEMAEIAKHSDAQLNAVKDVDVSFVEQQLTQVITLAKTMKLDTQKSSEKGFSLNKLITTVKASFIDIKEQMTAEFTDVASRIDTIIGEVDQATARVKEKLEGFDVMYNDNLTAYQNLTHLIFAAEEALEIKKHELDVLKANITDDLLQVEKINRLQGSIIRLEKRIVNFKKYQTMAIQTAPEITQMSDQALIIIEKFADIKSMTIPLWKRSIRKYIDGAVLRQSANLETTINNANNALLQENSNQAKDNAIAVARMNNRDAIDDETLEVINRNLIETIVEVSTINQNGVISRQNSVDRMEEMKRLYANIATGQVSIDEMKQQLPSPTKRLTK